MKRLILKSLLALTFSTVGLADHASPEKIALANLQLVADEIVDELMTDEQRSVFAGKLVLEGSSCQVPVGFGPRDLRCLLVFGDDAAHHVWIVAGHLGEAGDGVIESVINDYDGSGLIRPAVFAMSDAQKTDDIEAVADAIFHDSMNDDEKSLFGKAVDVAASRCEVPLGMSSRHLRCLISYKTELGHTLFLVNAFFGEPGEVFIEDVLEKWGQVY